MASFPFNKEKLIEICQAYDVVSVSLFGSMARGDATQTSDIDLLVKFGKRKSLLGVVRLEHELSDALGRKVDLVTEAAISPYIRENILRDLESLYGTP